MPSNEAIELLEGVLSSVSESERWQYRYADIVKKNRDKVEEELNKEKKKIENYGKKDRSKLDKLQDKLDHIIDKEYLGSDEEQKRIDSMRNGINNANERKKLSPSIEPQRIPREEVIDHRHKTLTGGHDRQGYGVDGIDVYMSNHSKLPSQNKPKNKEMHERINRRTAEAKHEAACILIEALNTLLNE